MLGQTGEGAVLECNKSGAPDDSLHLKEASLGESGGTSSEG